MNWNCKLVDVYTSEIDGHEKVIFNVHWRVEKEDKDYSASSYGTQSLNTENIENFIPYDDVTSEMVEGWVKDAMGEEEVSNIESNLDQQIENKKNPPYGTNELKN